MKDAFPSPDRPSSSLVIGLSLILMALIGLFEYARPVQVSIFVLYLVPLLLVATHAGIWVGIILSVLSAAPGFVGDVTWAIPVVIPLVAGWNALMRLVTFLVITYLCGELRRAREREASRDWADPVTGVGSHRLFHEVASAELARVQRTRRPFSLAYLDIDGLRGVNERLGYRAGDALLALVARTLDRDGRKADTCARIGGDELVLLMPETDPGGARTALQRILSVLSEIFREDGWPVTLSVGVVTFTEPPPGVDEMLRAAESCMYAAKRAGKNRVEFTEWDEAAPAAEVERSEQPDGAARDR